MHDDNTQHVTHNTQSSTPDLSTTLCTVRLPNPTVLASGILGLSHDVLARVARAGAGAVTAKSCSLKPRPGYPNPTILDWGPGLINAVGLSNPGVEVMVEEIRAAKEKLAPLGVPVIASIFAETIYDFGTVARFISEAEPDLIEVNISCPNIDDRYRQMFAADPYVVAQVTRRVKQNTDIPVLMKLSPNVTDVARIAQTAVEAGADGITGAISPAGKVLGTIPIGVRGEALIIDEQPIIGHVTFYARYPWVFPVTLFGGLLFIMIAAATSHRSRWRTTREVEKSEEREEEVLSDDTEKVIEAVPPDYPVSGGNGSKEKRQS